MRSEIKELLKDELKAVNQSKTSILIGSAMILLDILLVITSVFSIYSLIFILPLTIILRKQIQKYQLNQMMLIFTRFIIDDEFNEKDI